MTEIEVTPDYTKAKDLIDAGAPVVFITGKAGTGKSTLIQYLRGSLLKRQGDLVVHKQVAVLAPTGVAAFNARGATIHSFFRFPARALNPNDVREVQDKKLYKRLDVLILDEVSMIRADVLDAIDGFLRRNGKDSSLPFGGTQVVLVGDLFQLPPVVATKEEAALFSRRYTSEFFFSAQALSAAEVMAPVELGRVFRQKDENFVRLLNRVRLGDSSDDVLRELNPRANVPPPSESPIVLTPTNARADEINSEHMGSLKGDIQEYAGEVVGRFNVEEDKLPAPLHLKLKLGARVMFTKNDQGHRWINGTLGAVVDLKAEIIVVDVEGSLVRRVTVERTSWESYKYVYDESNDTIVAKVVATYTQFPLMPAWAITIHKSQGKTLPAVKIDLAGGAFAPGQAYVALSRARSLQDIWLARPLRASDIFCDERIRLFYARLFPNKVDDVGTPVAPVMGTRPDPSLLAQEPQTVAPGASSQTRDLVAAAIESGDTLQIRYLDGTGAATARTIRPRTWVDGDRFTAFCELRNAERDFRVSRIQSCQVVD